MDRCRSTHCPTTYAEVTLNPSIFSENTFSSLIRYSEGEIHFSLMAVVSELRRKYELELEQVLAGSERQYQQGELII